MPSRAKAPDPATPADRVRAARKAAGFTQAQLAACSGLHRRSIEDIERGKRELTADAALKIARATGNSPELILPGLGWGDGPARMLSLRPTPSGVWIPASPADLGLAKQIGGHYWGHPFRLVELAREHGVAVLYRGDWPIEEEPAAPSG